MPSPETLRSFTSDEFLTGLVVGFAALIVGVPIIYAWRRWQTLPAPIVGLLLTVAALLAMRSPSEPSSQIWFGVILLGLGGLAVRRNPGLPRMSAALAAPGAWWIVTDLPGPAWVPWLLFTWIVIGAPLVTSFDRHFVDRGYGPVLLLVSIAGMYTTLPDTEQILVVLGVMIPLVFLAWPRVLASLGGVGVYPVLGMLAWVIATGGVGREGAIVGATATLALLVIEPLIRMWRNQTLLDRTPNKWWWVPVVAGLQLVVVLLVARFAGLNDAPIESALVAAMALAGAAAVLAVGEVQWPSKPAQGGTESKKIPRGDD